MVTKICKCCGKEFTTEKNAQKHCSKKCRIVYGRMREKVRYKTYSCSWCGVVFDAERKRKYCSEECRLRANKRLGGKREIKSNPKVSIEEVAKLSREAGMSYGEYVRKYNL